MDSPSPNTDEKTHLVARHTKTRCLAGIFRLKRIEDEAQLATPLKRCLTTLELTLLGIGATLGMANYVIVGNVTKNLAGSGTFLSFLIAGVFALLSASCFAEFAAQIPRAGSAYTYAYVVAGEFFAFIAGWNIILEYLLGIAAIGRAFSGSLDNVVNNAISEWANDTLADLHENDVISARPDIVAFTAVLLAGAFVCVGAVPSIVSTCILTAANLCLTALTTVLGFYYASSKNFAEQHTGGVFPYGVDGVFSGAAMCFYAFYGLDAITIAAEEALTPSLSVPFAIFTATGASAIIYFIISISLSFLIPYYQIDVSSPFSAAFESNGIHWAGYVTGASSLISMSACLLITSFTLPRVIYSMSSDGLFFEVFSAVGKTRQVPTSAVLTSAGVAAILAMFFNMAFLTQFLSLGILFSYTIVAISVILHRYSPNEILAHKLDDVPLENQRAGELKERFKKWPVVRDCAPGTAVVTAVLFLVIFSIGLCVLVRVAEKNLSAGDWWTWLLFVILLGCCALSIAVMHLHKSKSAQVSTFQVPFVPLTPSLSIVCNVFLITKLTAINFLRFAVWMVIGLLIYFLYGIRHSKERKATRRGVDFLEFSSSSSDGDGEVITTEVKYPQPKSKPSTNYPGGDVTNLTRRETSSEYTNNHTKERTGEKLD